LSTDKEDEASTAVWKALLAANPVCRMVGGGTNAALRCPYCGDSEKSRSSAHFYVTLRVPFRFYCQRCNAGGPLTSEVMRDLSVRDDRVLMMVYKAEKDSKYSGRCVRVSGEGPLAVASRRAELTPAPPGSSEWEPRGLEYVSERMGFSMGSSEAWSVYRLCFGLTPFLDHNGIDFTTMKESEEKKLLPKVDRYGVGFLSSDRKVIDFRSRDVDQTGFRYYAYSIYGDPNSSKSYSIASDVDVCQERLTVVLTEGAFDLIGVQRHIWGGARDGIAWIACGGKGFNLALLNLMRAGFLDLDVHVYADSDVGVGFFHKLFGSDPRLLHHNYKVYYNDLHKDWGVPASMISAKGNNLRLTKGRYP
jgi:hypothetical protein